MEHSAKREILQVTDGCVRTRGEHNLEDGTNEDSGSDYLSAESDTEDDQNKVVSVVNENIVPSSSGGIKRHPQPKNVVIPSPDEELAIPGDSDNYAFVPTHPGLPVMPSVPPQSPQEKAQIAAREGKV